MKKLIKFIKGLFEDKGVLERQHYNRLREVIRHPKNKKIHFDSIHKMVENYKRMFGITNLYLILLEKQSNAYKNLIIKTQ